MRWLSKLFGGADAPKERRPRIVCELKSFPTAVVGESRYQDALLALCGGYSREGYNLEVEADLVPEPQNPYDSNAVKVTIEGRVVGYLSREDAVRFHEEMANGGFPNLGARCEAQIRGGWRTNQHDRGHFGVYLRIPGRGRFAFEQRTATIGGAD